jgi:hypothetical protein
MSESTVMTALTVEQRAEKGDEMASLVAQIDAIKSQAKAKAFEYRNAIDALHEQLVELSNAMRFGLEETSQMSLFAGQARESQTATQQLAEIAKHACSCEGGPESEVHSPACPVHGVTATAATPGAALDDADARLAAEVAATFEAATKPVDPEAAAAEDELVDAAQEAEESNVVDMAEALRKHEVDVGTVEEPAASKAHRARRARA